MTRCDVNAVELLTTDGVTTQKVLGRPVRHRFPRWREVLRQAAQRTKRARVCVDRRSLIAVLQALDKACPDKGGYNPVYIEIGGEDDSILLTAENYENGQRAVAVVSPLRVLGSWLTPDVWLRKLLGRSSARKVNGEEGV
jgi:hypothetical protein